MATTKPKETESIAEGLANDGLPPFVSSAANTAAKDIPVAAIVGDVAGDIDPIGPLIQKINPENITALSNGIAKITLDAGTATSVIMDATGRLINSSGQVIGSLVKGTTQIVDTTGKVFTNISEETLKTLKDLGVKAVGVVGKAVDTAIKEGSAVAKAAIQEFGETAKTAINAGAGVINNAVDKGASVAKTGIKNLTSAYETKKKADTLKSIIKYAIIGVIVLAIIIVIAVVASKPKKMTNNMSTPVEFDQNYNPESQPCFTEKEYKYYNELAI